MKKTTIIIAVCLIALASASLTLNKERTAAASSQDLPYPPTYVPDPIKYSAFFHYLVDLQEQANQLERAGKDGSSLRMYIQIQAGLDYEEARMLNEIAIACIKEVDQQDRKAMAVIEKFRAQFPDGRVPAGKGLPPPPPELKAMQQERDATLLRARDQYRYGVGGGGFAKVEDFIKREIAPNLHPVGVEKR